MDAGNNNANDHSIGIRIVYHDYISIVSSFKEPEFHSSCGAPKKDCDLKEQLI